ncbi:AlpA family transcriptional regulator [Flavobacteriaceae bacterium]|nr:AlpA family transcriptional regulator [Flavobacteriaceae bacterium]
MTNHKILRLPQVIEATGLSRSTIYAFMKKGEMPKAFSLTGGRAVGWLESDIQLWIDSKIQDKEVRDA